MEVMSNRVKVGDPVVSGVLALVAKFTNWFSFFFFACLFVCFFIFLESRNFFQYSKLDAYSTMKRFWSKF